MVNVHSSTTKSCGMISLVLGLISFALSPMIPWSGIPQILYLFPETSLFTLTLIIIVGTILSSLGIISGVIGTREKTWKNLAIAGLIISIYCTWLFVQTDLALIFPRYV